MKKSDGKPSAKKTTTRAKRRRAPKLIIAGELIVAFMAIRGEIMDGADESDENPLREVNLVPLRGNYMSNVAAGIEDGDVVLGMFPAPPRTYAMLGFDTAGNRHFLGVQFAHAPAMDWTTLFHEHLADANVCEHEASGWTTSMPAEIDDPQIKKLSSQFTQWREQRKNGQQEHGQSPD